MTTEAKLAAALEALAQYDANAVLRIKRMGAPPAPKPDADADIQDETSPVSDAMAGDVISPDASDEAF